MKAIWISKPGSYDVLQVRETEDPELKPGHVKIRVKASGLNFAEVMARQGMYPDAPKTPCVVGYEVSGVIEALGEGVSGYAVGERVLAMTRFGGHADCVVAPTQQVLKMPARMSFEEGAALPVTYLTAYHMLFRSAAVRKGESILIHMAAGGVGLAMLQLCKTIPNLTIFGTASASKHDTLRAAGVTHPIDYHTTDYASEVRKLTGGRGVDAVFDALGGKDWKKGYELLKPAGRLVAFGFANMMSPGKRNLLHIIKNGVGIPFFTPMRFMDDNRSISGVNMGHMWDESELLNEELTDILRLYDEGVVKPQIDSTFTFAQIADAHRRVEQRKNVGKIVLLP